MQAAANRSASVQRLRRSDRVNAIPHAGADGVDLLDALPIAAAIIERASDGAMKVAAHHSRFVQAVDRSSCTAGNWNDAECLKSGPIAEMLNKFFDGTDVSGELDFRDGEGVSAQYFRMKL